MTPKARYEALYRRMGTDWLWYAVSASDQLHVDLARSEMISHLNLALGLTGAVIALCANSPLHSDSLSGFASSREGVFLNGPYADRHGLPELPFRSYEDFASQIARLPHLLKRVNGQLVPARGSFHSYLLTHEPDLDDFLLHDHYVWQSARLRAAHGTIEMRAACQQPTDEPMAATALYLGIVEAAGELIDSLDMLGSDVWQRMVRYREDAARRGIRAEEPLPDFLAKVLEKVERGLVWRGRGEEVYLTPLWSRLEKREEPAQRVRRLYMDGDWDRLLAELTYSPDSPAG